MNLFRWILVGAGTLVMLGLFVYAHLSLSDRRRHQQQQRKQKTLGEERFYAAGETPLADPETLTSPFSSRAEPSLGNGAETPDTDPSLSQRDESNESAAEEGGPDSEIIVIYVSAQEGEYFTGRQILAAMREHDLRYGKMKIFHQVVEVDGRKESLFGIANMVEPGIFEGSAWDKLQTPGLALFLQIPAPIRGVDAFDTMIDTAVKLAETLHGKLLNDSRDALTTDWIDSVRIRLVSTMS